MGEVSERVREGGLKWCGHVLGRGGEWRWRCRGVGGEGDRGGGGWMASGATCRGEGYPGKTRKTGLDGGVS